MAEKLAVEDDLLDLMCDCNQLSVVKTRWYGENAGKRFRECGEEECGYHMWIDPPLGDRGVAVVEELQERSARNIEKYRRRMDRLIEKHEVQMTAVKRKQETTMIAMFVLFSCMMNMVLQELGQRPEVEDDESGSEEE